MALGLAGTPTLRAEDFSATKALSTGKTRLGLFGGPSNAALDFASKDPTEAKATGDYTRLGIGGFPRGQLGTFSKNPNPDVAIEFTAGEIVFAPQTFSILQDRVIEFTGIDVIPTLYDFEIIQGGQTVSFTAGSIELTPLPFDIDQEVAGSTYINFTPGEVVFTPQPFTIAQQKRLDFDVATLRFTPQPFDIIPGVLGEKTLTNADYLEIQNRFKNAKYAMGLTQSQVMSVLVAGVAGTGFGFKPEGQSYSVGDEFGYYGQDGVTKVIRARYVGGNRIIIELNPED